MAAPKSPFGPSAFQDDRATPTVLALLQEAKVGKMVGLAPLEEEGEDMEEIEPRPQEREGG